MNKNFIFKNIVPITILFSFLLSACSSSIDFFEVKHEEAQLFISKNKETSGAVIKPESVELEFTLSSLYKSDKHLLKRNLISSENRNPKMLVVPLHFKDSKEVTNAYEKIALKNNIEAVFNGDEKTTGYESVKTYYQKSSFNNVNFDIVLSDYYDTNVSSNTIKNKDDVVRLCSNALKNITIKNEKPSKNDFDQDGDGFIDSLFFIYDVHNYQRDSSINDVFWAFTYTKDFPTLSDNQLNFSTFSFASYDFMEKGENSELKLDARTYIHELGHQFGLEDYYDYAKDSSPTTYLSMMDSSLFDFEYYSKMIMGWTKPYIVYGEATINENELLASNSPVVVLDDDTIIKKKGDKYVFNPFNEYLIIDYFDFDNDLIKHDMTYGNKNIGFVEDYFIQKSGYRIYHVDNRLFEVSNSATNSFYNLLDTNSYLLKCIKNTTSTISPNSETQYMKTYGLSSNFPYNINALNELTLIAKKTEQINQYSSLYIKKQINDDYSVSSSLMKINEDYLFYSGDVFDIKNYYPYFLNGNREKVLFDNQKTMKTKIIFE